MNAEIIPPSNGWDQVAAQRSWGHRTLSRLNRRWKYGLLILLLLGGAGGVLLNVNPQDGPIASNRSQSVAYASNDHGSNLIAEVQQEVNSYERAVARTAAEAATGKKESGASSGGTAKANTSVKVGTMANGQQAELTGSSASPTPDPTEEQVAVSRSTKTDHQTTKADIEGQVASSTFFIKPDRSAVATRTEHRVKSSMSDESELVASTVRNVMPSIVSKARLIAVPPKTFRRSAEEHEAELMQPRVTYVERSLGKKRLRTSHQPAPKALPPGEWWVGGEIGVYSSNGKWVESKARARQLTRTANAAEEWRSGSSVDFVVGRQWTNGLRISAGIGLENVRSRFEFTEERDIPLSLDTNGTLVTEQVNYNSNNVISILRIPIEGAWNKQWRRFMVGPRVGLISEFTMTRSGLTLTKEGSDQQASVIDNTASTVSKNYPFRLSGSLGLDIGYMVTESLSLWLTPTYTNDLLSVGGGDMAPDLSRTGVRLRLQYVLQGKY